MRLRFVTIVSLAVLIAAACSGQGNDDPTPTAGTSAPATGGTLDVAMLSDFQAALDPAKEYEAVAAELFRCCLLRTLVAFEGVPGAEGGSELQPDLATELPTVSEDGLTWTFTIKDGIAYGPPYQDQTVTSQDFVRALEREADPKASVGGYSFYYSVIEGFDEYSEGKASTISGLSTPDDHTLEVTVTEPTGDLGQRFSLLATAPIPPLGKAPMGAAEGHTADYGRFLISTGPYMIQGSEDLDRDQAPDDQDPISGYVPGRSLVLVRNPSWQASQDTLRPAYVDEIDIAFGGELADLYAKVQAGDLDVVFDAGPPPDVIKEYSTDPALKPNLRVFESDNVSYLEMNILEPPFDDVHVRKAMNLAIDKQGLRTLLGGEVKGDLTGHIMPNSLEGQLLVDYDPYATPDSAGDPEAARAEMAQSKYGDADGRCVGSCVRRRTGVHHQSGRVPEPSRADPAELGGDRDQARHQVTQHVDHVLEMRGSCRAHGRLHRAGVEQGLRRRRDVRLAVVQLGQHLPQLLQRPAGWGSGFLAEGVRLPSTGRAERRRRHPGVRRPGRAAEAPVLGRPGLETHGRGRSVGALAHQQQRVRHVGPGDGLLVRPVVGQPGTGADGTGTHRKLAVRPRERRSEASRLPDELSDAHDDEQLTADQLSQGPSNVLPRQLVLSDRAQEGSPPGGIGAPEFTRPEARRYAPSRGVGRRTASGARGTRSP